ncbi:hypothetical protein ABI59_11140 [Acidobacteria bacterium Mor1]|nr:hypothetical protein ABI59_11140 [Acidobacteria bacterium Mor1]
MSSGQDPAVVLEEGRLLLDPLMSSHGFIWRPGPIGAGSGGAFASGAFERATRRLELHFRRSLGLVAYGLGDRSVRHESLMRVIEGARSEHRYPGFSKEPLEAFADLLHDLNRLGRFFLEGTDAELQSLMDRVRPSGRRLPS